MKFSYDLFEKFIKPKSRDELLDSLTMKAFEAEPVSGDTFNAEIPHNRYADAASHLGIAREYSAISGKKLSEPEIAKVFPSKTGGIDAIIKDLDSCLRYGAAEFELRKKGATPKWMKKVLKDCGLRSIHPVVDILNYVMLEVGQPLHAFDVKKLKGNITVRRAVKDEKITTIDGQRFALDAGMLVIADDSKAQAIAGIKGGKASEVSAKTRKIIVEAANFDSVSIYRTSRKLGLVTDASQRFAHGMSPYSVELGLGRTKVLLEEILGAEFIGAVDVYPKKQNKKLIGFSVKKFNSISGLELKTAEIVKYLTALGFTKRPKRGKFDFLVGVPPLRMDVSIFEDLVEEVVRLYGMDKLKPAPPVIHMSQAKEEDAIVFKDKVRNILTAAGFSEVYTYSYTDKKSATSYELENPIAENKKYLRQDLSEGLGNALENNSRFFETIKLFEIGGMFDKELGERTFVGLAVKEKNDDPFLDLKGVSEKMLHRLGIVEFTFVPSGTELEVHSSGKVLGIVGISGKNAALAEFDLGELLSVAEGEYEFKEIPKYPAVMRDISLELKESVKVGDILNEVRSSGAKNLLDVDLIDYYDSRHMTFRMIFQSSQKTLKDVEVNKEMEKISAFLKKKFSLEIR